MSLDEKGLEAIFEKVREKRTPAPTSEDVVFGALGRGLYERFFKNCTHKHLELDPSQLNPGVAPRVPVRYDRYWKD